MRLPGGMLRSSCVGSEKNLKLFLDFFTTYPALSRGINEMRILSEKGTSCSQSYPLSPARKLSSASMAALLGLAKQESCQQLSDCVRLEASLPQEPRS